MSVIKREDAINYLVTNMNWIDEDGYIVDDADEKKAIITDLISGVPDADDGWISVEKKLPEDGQIIIACYPTLKSGCMMLEYDKTHNYGFVAWMPLPKPYEPKEEK